MMRRAAFAALAFGALAVPAAAHADTPARQAWTRTGAAAHRRFAERLTEAAVAQTVGELYRRIGGATAQRTDMPG